MLSDWTDVVVKAEKKKDMTYSFTFKNQNGQVVWGSKIRPLPNARNFLAGMGMRKNKDYDFTADKTTGEYCYSFADPEVATLFSLWFQKDTPESTHTHSLVHTCPECGNQFKG